MGRVDDQFIILLDIDRVFSSEELVVVMDAGEINADEAGDAETVAMS